MYYVYRYLDNNESPIYIGITNDLIARRRDHQRNSAWYSDNLIYQFLKVKNKYIAKTYEEYLINKDNPKENKASKNAYDVSEIEFHLEHDWTDFREIETEERKRTKGKKYSAKYLRTKEEQRLERLFAYEMFFLYSDRIVEINWSNGSITYVVFDSNEVKKFAIDCKWMPPFFSEIHGSEDHDITKLVLNNSGIRYRNSDDQRAFNQICGLLVEIMQSSYLNGDLKAQCRNEKNIFNSRLL